MSLHGDIMNIRTPPEVEHSPRYERVIYKNGHRDARHAAADLALTYENLVDTLERSLEETLSYVGNDTITTDLTEMLETIQKVKSGEYK